MTITLDNRMQIMREKMEEVQKSKIISEQKFISAKQNVTSTKDIVNKLETTELNYDKAIIEFSRISTEKAVSAKEELEQVLNWALSNIEMEQNYSAEIVETDRGSNRGLSIVLYDTDTGYARDIEEQSGTALAQMISFLMLVIVIKFSGCSRIMILDEVFSGVDDENTVRMFGEILVALAENEGFQFIYVEHQNILDEILGMNVIDVVQKKYKDGTIIRNQYTVGSEESEQ